MNFCQDQRKYLQKPEKYEIILCCLRMFNRKAFIIKKSLL